MAKLEQSTYSVDNVNALLGSGSEFEGKLHFEGTVRIDGKFTGTITSKDVLVIGEDAIVNADIEVGTLIIYGVVNGNLIASDLIEIHSPAKVKGELKTPELVIERGVKFDGKCEMGLDRRDAVVTPMPDHDTGLDDS